MKPNNKIALVTGGNKGIGLEICKKLAFNRVDIILTSRDEKRVKEAVEAFIRDYDLTNIIFHHQLDVTDRSSIKSLVGFVENQFGKLEILVNNAVVGGFEVTKAIDEKLPQEERAAIFLNKMTDNYKKAGDCFKTNYYGVKNMMEVFLLLVQLSNFGRIVNVSSSHARLQVRNELMDIDNLTVERNQDLAKSLLKSVEDNTFGLEENRWMTVQSP